MSQLTAVEHVAWRLSDIREDDIVLSKSLSVKQEVNVIQLRKGTRTQEHFVYSVFYSWCFATRRQGM